MPELHDFPANTLVDYRGDFENKLGSRTGRVVLIRPDAYVAFDLAALDADAFKEQLRQWNTESILPKTAIFEEVPTHVSLPLTRW